MKLKFSTTLQVLRAEFSRPWRYRLSQRRKYSNIRSVEQLVERCQDYYPTGDNLSSLDLGCGKSINNIFLTGDAWGLDIQEIEDSRIICADLFLNPIPFEGSRFDFLTAFDFLEHVPRVLVDTGKTRFPFVELMGEIHRVLRPGGIFLHRTPAYPAKEAFLDPTHVNLLTEDTFPMYFCSNALGKRPMASIYGYDGNFELIEQRWCGCWLVGVMRKI